MRDTPITGFQKKVILKKIAARSAAGAELNHDTGVETALFSVLCQEAKLFHTEYWVSRYKEMSRKSIKFSLMLNTARDIAKNRGVL